MTDDTSLPFSFPAVSRKKITASFDGGKLTSDGGVMLLAMADRRLGPVAPTCKMATARLSVNLDKSRGQRHPHEIRERNLTIERFRRPENNAWARMARHRSRAK